LAPDEIGRFSRATVALSVRQERSRISHVSAFRQ